jgi:hypothetical protein
MPLANIAICGVFCGRSMLATEAFNENSAPYSRVKAILCAPVSLPLQRATAINLQDDGC